LQISGNLDVAGQVAEDHVEGGGDGHRADGQAVQAVGEVDGVGAPHDDKDRKRDEEEAQLRLELFEKGMVRVVSNAGLTYNQMAGTRATRVWVTSLARPLSPWLCFLMTLR